MSEIPLNKFEKEQKVIELYKAGKTSKEIAKIAHKNFCVIKKIITAYEKKLKEKKVTNQLNQKTF